MSIENKKPIVNWQDPKTTPSVSKYDMDMFWLAVKLTRSNGESENHVFSAFYMNKPLEYSESDSENEYPLDDHHHVDVDGYPVEAVGWHRSLGHSDFDNYYEPITFNSDYQLLGWGEYLEPEFTKTTNGAQ